MKLLVTGCAGFIGSNFVYYYLREHAKDEIIGLDKLTYAGNLANLSDLPSSSKERFTFVKGDICDNSLLTKLFDEHDIKKVVNFAAESHVDRSLYDPQLFLETNIFGAHALMETSKSYWQKGGEWDEQAKFVQISTDEVYGTLGPEGYFTEETPIQPRSPYSASKASADLIAQSYYETFNFPVVITRCSNNYGPYQFPEKLIPLMIINCLKHEKLPIYGDGKQVRDWIFVKDHCRAIDLAISNANPGSVYNIGAENERTNLSVVKHIIESVSNHLNDDSINEELITFVKDRPGHDRRYAIDANKIMSELGWQPKVDFEKGLDSTVKWYVNHQEWTRQVISGEYRDFYRRHYGKDIEI